MSRSNAETDRLCMEYQQRLTTFGAGARSLHFGLPHGPENCVEVTPPTPPGRQPHLGRMKIAIFTKGKQVKAGDGHARAARREKAWYPF